MILPNEEYINCFLTLERLLYSYYHYLHVKSVSCRQTLNLFVPDCHIDRLILGLVSTAPDRPFKPVGVCHKLTMARGGQRLPSRLNSSPIQSEGSPTDAESLVFLGPPDRPQKIEERFSEGLETFRWNSDWIGTWELRLFQAIQLALNHPVYGTGLRVYFYIGPATDKKTHVGYHAFISKQTFRGNGPPNTKRFWATRSVAIYLQERGPGFVNLAEILLLKPQGTRIYGRIWGNHGGSWPSEGFRNKLAMDLRHLLVGHPKLYDILCRHFVKKWWPCLKRRAGRMLNQGKETPSYEYCGKLPCRLLRDLWEAHGGDLDATSGSSDAGPDRKTRSSPEKIHSSPEL